MVEPSLKVLPLLLQEFSSLAKILELPYASIRTSCTAPIHLTTPWDTKHEIYLPLPVKAKVSKRIRSWGIPIPFVEELVEIHIAKAVNLANEFKQTYDELVVDIGAIPTSHEDVQSSLRMDDLIRRMRSWLEASYLNTLKKWVNEMRCSALTCNLGRNLERHADNSDFNTEFIPTLESAYCRNTHPSRAEKLALAKQSGMSFKQIHYWFQNRRRRAKAVRPRHSQSVSVHQSKEVKLEERFHETFVDSDATEYDPDFDDTISQVGKRSWSRASSFTVIDEAMPSFSHISPAYSFPTCYPPPVDGPIRSTFKFQRPTWERKSRDSTIVLPDTGPFDVGVLVDSLRYMHLGDCLELSENNHNSLYREAVSPFVRQAIPAPLSSLIRLHSFRDNS